MIKKILAPTDLSELSRAGVRYALNKAKDHGAEVIIYHVVTADEMLNLSERVSKDGFGRSDSSNLLKNFLETYRLSLARFVRQNFFDLLPFVRVDERVELGSADKNILEQAEKEGVDLIVMSTHGRTGLSRAFLGSVTERVVRNAPCLVLAIPPHLTEVGAVVGEGSVGGKSA
jgi:nucleotide-binding universal stress UspA family protein